MEITNKKPLKLRDVVLIGNYEEVDRVPASSIVGGLSDDTVLDGLIIRGMEMRFGVTNENGERYDRDAFDKFIKEYYLERGLNLPLTVQHRDDIEHIVGRVLLMDVRDDGVYYVAYIPRDVKNYAVVRSLLLHGILQGFSKEGWALQWEWIEDSESPELSYINIKEMALTALSLVCIPANGIPFESTDEVRNTLQFRKNAKKKTLKSMLKK